ncbi:MAG: enoyl-CoA hydratase/isomerase family protein [Acidimicrobiia bacterium]
MGRTVETLGFGVRDHVATIMLNRPERRNAWTLAMADELHDALTWCRGDDDVRVVIVTGAGDAFSVGLDLDHDVLPGGARQLSPHDVGKPVIAAINGDAVGIGASYAMQCDIRVIADNARMGFLALHGTALMTWARHGPDRSLTGRVFAANDALAIGLCHHVVPASEVLTVARSIAAGIVANR